MPREGFHPDYHDDSFYQGVPPGQDDDGEDRAPPPGGARGVLARLRARLGAFQAANGLVLPAATVALVLVLGYVMLPTMPGAPPRAGNPANRAVPASPTLATVPAPAPTSGATVTSIRPAAAPERALDILGHDLAIGTRGVAATSDAWGEPRTLHLYARTVTADGKVVDAMPMATALALFWCVVLGGFAAGSGCGYLVDLVREKGYIPQSGHETLPGRLTSGLVTLAAILPAMSYVPEDALVLALAAAGATLMARKWFRLRVFLGMLGLVSAGMALSAPVVAPHQALAADYGRFGIYAGDMAACLGAAFLAAALWFAAARIPRSA